MAANSFFLNNKIKLLVANIGHSWPFSSPPLPLVGNFFSKPPPPSPPEEPSPRHHLLLWWVNSSHSSPPSPPEEPSAVRYGAAHLNSWIRM